VGVKGEPLSELILLGGEELVFLNGKLLQIIVRSEHASPKKTETYPLGFSCG